MKKFLSVLLTFLILSTVISVATVYAETDTTEIIENVPEVEPTYEPELEEPIFPFFSNEEIKDILTENFGKYDYKVLILRTFEDFCIVRDYHAYNTVKERNVFIGDYLFSIKKEQFPYDLGIYIVTKNREAYTLEDAYELGKFDFEKIFNVLLYNCYETTYNLYDFTDPFDVRSILGSSGYRTNGCETIKTISKDHLIVSAWSNNKKSIEEDIEIGNYRFHTNYQYFEYRLGIFDIQIFDNKIIVNSLEQLAESGKNNGEIELIVNAIKETMSKGTEFNFTIENIDEELSKDITALNNSGYVCDWVEKVGCIDDYNIYYCGNNTSQKFTYSTIIGNYKFNINSRLSPYDLGVFLVKGDNAYTLPNAYNQGIIDDNTFDSIIKLFSDINTGWSAEKLSHNEKLFTEFLKYNGILQSPIPFIENAINDYKYEELGRIGECTLFYGYGFCVDTPLDFEIGKYKFAGDYSCMPYGVGLFVIKDGGIYTLTSAYRNGFIDLESAVQLINDSSVNFNWVLSVKETAVNLKNSSASIYINGTASIKTSVDNPNGETTFKSSNENVAIVDSNGKVTGKKSGNADISVTNNGVTKIFKVTVKNPELSKTSITVKKGALKSVKIKGKIVGVNNSYSNTKKAKVISNNTASTIRIRGIKKGNTTLKIKVSGIPLKLKVNVK